MNTTSIKNLSKVNPYSIANKVPLNLSYEDIRQIADDYNIKIPSGTPSISSSQSITPLIINDIIRNIENNVINEELNEVSDDELLDKKKGSITL